MRPAAARACRAIAAADAALPAPRPEAHGGPAPGAQPAAGATDARCMNAPNLREPRPATAVLPALDPPADDFAATAVDRPAFDVAALSSAPTGTPPATARPERPPPARPAPPPESDALLWILLVLLLATALGIACGLTIGLVRALDPSPAPLLESGAEPEPP